LGKRNEAEVLYRKALNILKNKFGFISNEVADMLITLGGLLWVDGRIDEAKDLYLESFDTIQKNENSPSDALSDGYRELGARLRDSGFYEEADIYLSRALEIKQDLYGLSSSTTALELSASGKLRVMQQRYEEAEVLLKRCFDIVINDVPLDKLKVIRIKERLQSLYQAWGKPEEAANYQSTD
jgi:serine/threonine-protein kinase